MTKKSVVRPLKISPAICLALEAMSYRENGNTYSGLALDHRKLSAYGISLGLTMDLFSLGKMIGM